VSRPNESFPDIRVCICLLAAALFAPAAGRLHAQQTSAPVFETEVIVTADRGENERERLSVPTVVLTRQDIERTPGATLADAIEALPGFQMLFAPGSSFRPTTVARAFFGGGEAEYVKLLVDGIPMNDAESGLVDWAQIPLFAIERIEAVRGPASAVYGDTSLGGVIQVFTQGPAVRHGRAHIGGGTYGHRSLNAAYRQPFGTLNADMLGSYSASRGFRTHSALRAVRVGARPHLLRGYGERRRAIRPAGANAAPCARTW
jgi:outer membrane cobalamin receptor